VAVEPVGEAEQLSQPVQCRFLELLEDRGRAPEDADLVQAGRQHLGEDPGLGRSAGEVGEVAGALPVSDAVHEHLVDVAEDGLERVRSVRRLGR
jgi:hypothetical protein